MLDTWRPTREQLAAAIGKTVPDVIAPDLHVLFCGINPSLYSAAVQHHFARPGNRFWPALHAAGLTRHLMSPFEDVRLLEHGYGLSNLVDRATATANVLTDDELRAGRRKLERKLRRYGPRAVAFLGISAYRTAFDRPDAGLGRQAEKIADSAIWVLPNPSGLNAHYQLRDLARLYGALRQAVRARND